MYSFTDWYARRSIHLIGTNALFLGMTLVPFAWAGDFPWWLLFAVFTGPIALWPICVLAAERQPVHDQPSKTPYLLTCQIRVNGEWRLMRWHIQIDETQNLEQQKNSAAERLLAREPHEDHRFLRMRRL